MFEKFDKAGVGGLARSVARGFVRTCAKDAWQACVQDTDFNSLQHHAPAALKAKIYKYIAPRIRAGIGPEPVVS